MRRSLITAIFVLLSSGLLGTSAEARSKSPEPSAEQAPAAVWLWAAEQWSQGLQALTTGVEQGRQWLASRFAGDVKSDGESGAKSGDGSNAVIGPAPTLPQEPQSAAFPQIDPGG